MTMQEPKRESSMVVSRPLQRGKCSALVSESRPERSPTLRGFSSEVPRLKLLKPKRSPLEWTKRFLFLFFFCFLKSSISQKSPKKIKKKEKMKKQRVESM